MMHINKANINNLTGLWKKYGSQQIGKNKFPFLRINTHWPNRCWFDWKGISDKTSRKTLQEHANDNRLFDELSESTVVSVWPIMSLVNKNELNDQFAQQLIENSLIEKNWVCGFKQMAMSLKLQNKSSHLPSTRPEFQVKTVCTLKEVKEWVDIGSEAFSYNIDRSVIEQLINDKDIQILLGIQNDQAVACALLYKTDDVIGLHQFGVKQAFQGQGIARYFMQEILAACIVWRGEYVVLQASLAGQPLYFSLGFEELFYIKNYQKIRPYNT